MNAHINGPSEGIVFMPENACILKDSLFFPTTEKQAEKTVAAPDFSGKKIPDCLTN